MAKRFLHISFDFADADPQVEKLQPVFDKAIDSGCSFSTWDRRGQSQKRYVRTA